MSSDWLAGIFRWLRSVIEEADRPLSLLIVIILPFIAPVIPSWITANNLIRFMDYTTPQAFLAAIAFALVGYASMIATIGSIMNLIEKEKSNRAWLLVYISGGSYFTYVLALITVNIVLEIQNGVEGTQVFVTALMTLGLEIPASLLNGTRISNRDSGEKNERVRQENRQDKMDRFKIKHGVYNQTLPTPSRVESTKKASEYKEKIWKLLDESYQKGKLLRVVDVTNYFKLDYEKAKGFCSTQRTLWAQSRGVSLEREKGN